MIQWLGFWVFTTVAWVQSLVRELRLCKKKKKKKEKNSLWKLKNNNNSLWQFQNLYDTWLNFFFNVVCILNHNFRFLKLILEHEVIFFFSPLNTSDLHINHQGGWSAFSTTAELDLSAMCRGHCLQWRNQDVATQPRHLSDMPKGCNILLGNCE